MIRFAILFLSETLSRFRLMLSSMSPPPRLRHHDFFNISETTKARNSKIEHGIALDSLYTFTEYDVNRLAENRLNVFISGYDWVAISR